MGINVSLDNNILYSTQKANQKVQLDHLAKKLETVDISKRFLVDTFYTKLYDYVHAEEPAEMDADVIELYNKYPMYAIQTATSYKSDVLKLFIDRLRNGEFTGHFAVKLNGWHVRLIYRNGEFYKAYNKAGRDLTNQLTPYLENNNCLVIEDFEQLDLAEIRGELVINKENLSEVQENTNDTVSSYTGVGLLCDMPNSSAWELLNFLAYNIIADGVKFSTKTEEYQYLEDLGFEIPMYWVVEGLNKETLLEDLDSIVTDCETEVRASDIQEEYAYLTDGLIFSVDDTNYFRKLGKSRSKYQYGNINLRIGYWKQNTYEGYIQTIYWQQALNQLTPYAVIAREPNMIEFADYGVYDYIRNLTVIKNKNELGVDTDEGPVLLVPLYNPNQILRLDSYVNTKIYFVNDSVLGVLPCFDDGRVLLDGLLQEVIKGETVFL